MSLTYKGFECSVEMAGPPTRFELPKEHQAVRVMVWRGPGEFRLVPSLRSTARVYDFWVLLTPRQREKQRLESVRTTKYHARGIEYVLPREAGIGDPSARWGKGDWDLIWEALETCYRKITTVLEVRDP